MNNRSSRKGKPVPFLYPNGASGNIYPSTIPNSEWDVHHGTGFDGTRVNSPRTYDIPATNTTLVDFGGGAPIISVPNADLQVLSGAVMDSKDKTA